MDCFLSVILASESGPVLSSAGAVKTAISGVEPELPEELLLDFKIPVQNEIRTILKKSPAEVQNLNRQLIRIKEALVIA